MMKKVLVVLLLSALVGACSTLGVGASAGGGSNGVGFGLGIGSGIRF